MHFSSCFIFIVASSFRSGEDVSIVDITEGRDLVLSVSENSPALNDFLRHKSIFILRVTEVDIKAKKAVMLKDIPISEQDEYMAKAHAPKKTSELKARSTLHSIRVKVLKTLRKRGIPTLLNMRHDLGLSTKIPQEQVTEQTMDKPNISLEKIISLLEQFRILLSEEQAKELYELLDSDKNGFVDFGEFIRGIIGGMSETRHLIVRKAWLKVN